MGIQLLDIGDGDVESDGDPGFGCNPCLTMNRWLRVAVVDDPLEVDIAQPPGRFAGGSGEPFPIFIGVSINLAIWLSDVCGGNN